MAAGTAREPAHAQWFAKVYLGEGDGGNDHRKIGEIPLAGTLSESLTKLDTALTDAPDDKVDAISRITLVKRAATAAKLAWEPKPRTKKATATK